MRRGEKPEKRMRRAPQAPQFANAHDGGSLASWPGPEPSPAERDRLQQALDEHKQTHTVQAALESVEVLDEMMKAFHRCGLIPNKHAMRIYLQHCCAKSASFEAEMICFASANCALDMMQVHKCTFDVSTVLQIAMQISFRAMMKNVSDFVQNLVAKSLTYLSCHERSFIARHLTAALAERHAATHASLNRSKTFAESDIRIDWDGSDSQELRLYNSASGQKKAYRPVEGYGFAKKGLFALLSIEDPEARQPPYDGRRDGALIEVTKAEEGEPLVVKLTTQVCVPFRGRYRYRLDAVDTAEVQTRRVASALQILGRDPHPQSRRLAPHDYLSRVLSLPLEEPYKVRIVLRSKVATLENELEITEYEKEPITIKYWSRCLV